MRILITSVGGTMIPLLTRFLKRDKQLLNLYIVGIDKRKIKKDPHLDKFYQISSKNDKNYVQRVEKILKKEKIKLLIPCSDKEAYILSKLKKKFIKLGTKILVNNKKIVKTICNKYLTYKILKKKGIKIPNFKIVKNNIQLKKALKKFNYPNNGVVLKPINSRGGRGVIMLRGKNLTFKKKIIKGLREKLVVHEKKNFSKKIFKYGDLMVMDFLKQPAYDIDNFRYKKFKFMVVRKRINPSGIPYKGNYILHDKKIEKYCNQITKALKLDYLTDIDLLTSAQDNEPMLLEVNPRPSGSAVISYKANIPFFSIVIAKMMNKKYSFKNQSIKINKALRI